MSKRLYLSVSGGLFLAVALLHLVRVLLGWSFELGPWSIPPWLSWIAFAAAAALAVWAWRLNRN